MSGSLTHALLMHGTVDMRRYIGIENSSRKGAREQCAWCDPLVCDSLLMIRGRLYAQSNLMLMHC
jgi:hypothetical protein